jgi:hypothetical protein
MSATSSGIVGKEIPCVFMEVLKYLLNKTCLDKVRRVRKSDSMAPKRLSDHGLAQCFSTRIPRENAE